MFLCHIDIAFIRVGGKLFLGGKCFKKINQSINYGKF